MVKARLSASREFALAHMSDGVCSEPVDVWLGKVEVQRPRHGCDGHPHVVYECVYKDRHEHHDLKGGRVKNESQGEEKC